MASVVINVLRKRQGRSGKEFREEDYTASMNIKRQLLRYPSSRKGYQLTPTDEAAMKIQRSWRGYLLRQQLHGLVGENVISWNSVIDALEIIARWHLGWTRFFFQILVGIFFIVTVYFQAFDSKPATFDVNSALLDRLRYAMSANTLPQVNQPVDAFEFVSFVVSKFYTARLVDSPFCQDQLSEYCAMNSNVNDSYWEGILSRNCTLVDTTSGSSDYVDQANQLIGSSFITQTRKQEKPCASRFIALNDVLDSRQLRIKYCLDEVRESNLFVTDSCRSSAAFPNFSSPSCQPQAENAGDFTFNDKLQKYLVTLQVGLSLAIPAQAIQCKIDRLQRIGWLDYRSKEVCLHLGFLNKYDDGRLMSYRECFVFTNGGRVATSRYVASTSLYTNPTTALAFTWTLIALMLIRLMVSFALHYRERHLLNKRKKRRVPFVTLRGIIALTPVLLMLTGCVVFLVVVYTMSAIETNSTATESFEGFISILTEADWALKLWMTYVSITSVALLIMLGKTISSLDFHPTSAIVSGTLRRASSNLGCFALIYSFVVLSYAFVGMLLIGRTRYEFSTFSLAINTLLFASIGELQRITDIIFYFNADDEYVVIIQALYIWSFILLVTILLMNVLLSIIVGAFVDLQEKSEKSLEGKPILTFLRSLETSLFFYGEGAWIYSKRFAKRGYCCPCCERFRRSKTPNQDGDDTLQTPWEKLLSFPNQPFNTGAESAHHVRLRLGKVFTSEKTVELIIARCRAKTRAEKIAKFGFHLRGLDPDSIALKGHSVYLLESILKKLGGAQTGRDRATLASTRSWHSNHDNRPRSNSQDEMFDDTTDEPEPSVDVIEPTSPAAASVAGNEQQPKMNKVIDERGSETV